MQKAFPELRKQFNFLFYPFEHGGSNPSRLVVVPLGKTLHLLLSVKDECVHLMVDVIRTDAPRFCQVTPGWLFTVTECGIKKNNESRVAL